VTYVFVFLGEFGYELLNWQGVVRKFRRLNPNVSVVAVSRGGVAPLYEGADYVDLADVPEFRASVATGYWALREGDDVLASEANLAHEQKLRDAIKGHVNTVMRERHGRRWDARRLRGVKWVWSSERTELGDTTFGADRLIFGSVPAEGDIYYLLDLANNMYAPIEPDLGARAGLEERLGWSLDEPYVLVQTRRRDIRTRSDARVDEAAIVAALAKRMQVVLLDFSSGRAGDSYSKLEESAGARRASVTGFPEQSCLIAAARHCVFLTEGDYGSHIYVPPLLGKDVWSVAPRDVYELGTTPIDHWNLHVFARSGGQIHPVVAEDTDPEELAELVVAG